MFYTETMKWRVCLIAVVLFLAPICAQAKSWRFSGWNVALRIQPDASVLVQEWQTFVFDGDFSYVTRDLPKSKGILYRDIAVFDENGRQLSGSEVEIFNKQTSAHIQVNFSARDEERTWMFQYTAVNALGFFATYDELYWNAVSQDRDVPIDAVSVAVVPPRFIPGADVRQRLFVGPVGSTTESTEYHVTGDGVMSFFGSNVAPSETFTIVAGWPKGIVVETISKPTRTPLQKIALGFLFVIFLSPFSLLIFLVRRWRNRGRDPKGQETIIPQYDPPDDAQPAVMGVLLHEAAGRGELSATIVDLAVRGFLRIEEIQEGLFRKKSFAFQKWHKQLNDATLLSYERDLLKRIFEEGDRVTIADLKDSFYKSMPALKKSMVNEAVAKGYFSENPEKTRNRYYAYSVIFFVLTAAFGFLWEPLNADVFPEFIIAFPALILDGALFLLFAGAMPRRTKKGVAAREWALGFKLYLHTAERYRIAAMTTETFERFLPYAMIFGVEKEWAKQFQHLYTEPPTWYVGPHAAVFNLVAFSGDFSGAMNTNVANALAASPSSSSGFGGGGFGGGGGGGGGSGAG